MTASFRKIDYSLRPAKHAERRMFVEIIRRLAVFQPVEDYRYIGFGSVWFSDFILFHKALGIRNMLSIEGSQGARERIEANKPFQISVEYENSSVVLPRIGWEQRSVVWLDYDDPLNNTMLEDVATVAGHAVSGTLLAVSVQCMKAPQYAEAERQRATDENAISAIDRFRNDFGNHRVPHDATDGDLTGWPYGNVARKMIRSEIDSRLSMRNLAAENKLRFEHICDIEYQDDAKMATIVGIIVSELEMERFESCRFGNIDFIAEFDRSVRIEMPKLTIRELRKLEQLLPGGDPLEVGHIPMSEATKFRRMYRYFPNFSVMES